VKSTGPSGIVVSKMSKAAGDFGIHWMTDLCNSVVLEGKFQWIGGNVG
jgi:hypothetical protein